MRFGNDLAISACGGRGTGALPRTPAYFEKAKAGMVL